MDVKGMGPVIQGHVSREPQALGARPHRNRVEPAKPSQAVEAGELRGELAQKLLQESGIKQADLAKYQVKLDIDDGTGRVVAEIRDRESGDLVTEVPSRELLRQAAMLQEVLGTILDKPV